jgi:hypothetical protein
MDRDSAAPGTRRSGEPLPCGLGQFDLPRLAELHDRTGSRGASPRGGNGRGGSLRHSLLTAPFPPTDGVETLSVAASTT